MAQAQREGLPRGAPRGAAAQGPRLLSGSAAGAVGWCERRPLLQLGGPATRVASRRGMHEVERRFCCGGSVLRCVPLRTVWRRGKRAAAAAPGLLCLRPGVRRQCAGLRFRRVLVLVQSSAREAVKCV